jgi:hypothetical protein
MGGASFSGGIKGVEKDREGTRGPTAFLFLEAGLGILSCSSKLRARPAGLMPIVPRAHN